MPIRTVPILPCAGLDEIARFYGAIGFQVTHRQLRPNPYLALRRDDVDLHFAAIEGFQPESSYASVILVVPDGASLYGSFADGLRAEFGKLPIAGIPRITRPRRKQGTTGGFTVVDPGGNWIRISVSAEDAADATIDAGVLDRVLRNAARQADDRGDEQQAVSILRVGLLRHADASAADRIPVLIFLCELLVRRGDLAAATIEAGRVRTLFQQADQPTRDRVAHQMDAVDDMGL